MNKDFESLKDRGEFYRGMIDANRFYGRQVKSTSRSNRAYQDGIKRVQEQLGIPKDQCLRDFIEIVRKIK